MRTACKTLPALALLAWTLPLAAQEAPADAPVAEEPAAEAPVAEEPAAEAPAPEAAGEAEGQPGGEAPAEAEAAETDPALDMGQPVQSGEPAEPAAGQEYVREEIGDWSIVCVRDDEEREICQMGQILLDENDAAVAEIRLAPLPPGSDAAAIAVITAPLMTLLTEGLSLSVDGGEATRYAFFTCTERGCISRIGLSEEMIAAFKRGNRATVTVVPAVAPDESVSVDVSLSGFTSAFELDATPGATGPGVPAAPEAAE